MIITITLELDTDGFLSRDEEAFNKSSDKQIAEWVHFNLGSAAELEKMPIQDIDWDDVFNRDARIASVKVSR